MERLWSTLLHPREIVLARIKYEVARERGVISEVQYAQAALWRCVDIFVFWLKGEERPGWLERLVAAVRGRFVLSVHRTTAGRRVGGLRSPRLLFMPPAA